MTISLLEYRMICGSLIDDWEEYMFLNSIKEALDDRDIGYWMAAEDVMETNGCFIDVGGGMRVEVHRKRRINENAIGTDGVLFMARMPDIKPEDIERIAEICAMHDMNFR